VTAKTEEKILKKLDRIEKLLIKVIPQKRMPKGELTEEEFLEIAKEGRREYREGKLEDFEKFIEREYPQYVKKKNERKAIQPV